jgi:pyruvate/2-oxoglutarate dehydrogenase complex dihydrolipoamide dehydrogenase (E3) component
MQHECDLIILGGGPAGTATTADAADVESIG